MAVLPEVSYDDFQRLHMAAGKIVEVQDFPRARKPTYKVRIDFGSALGERWSSVQAKHEYTSEELLGRLIVAVLNFPPKNVAGFQSEVLILGVPAEDGSLSLLEPSRGARLGGRVY
jgi:tRNA-binding protein